jgi:hypothetical protein
VLGRCQWLNGGVVTLMNGRKVISAAAVLMLAMVGVLSSVRPASAASTAYTHLVFTPPQIAPDGSLSAGATAPQVCVQPEQGGLPVSAQSISLSLATKYAPTGYTSNSSATAGASLTPLTSTPTPILANQTCGTLLDAVIITYTAPSPYPSPRDGLDQIAAVNPGDPTVSATDIYRFAPTTKYAFSLGALVNNVAPPIAACATLGVGQAAPPFTVTAEDSSNSPVGDTGVILSLTNSVGGAPSGSAKADGSNGSGQTVTQVGRHVITYATGPETGQVIIHYTAGKTPSPFRDILTVVEWHGPVNASTFYSYNCFAPQGVGKPVVTTSGTQTLVFWQGTSDNHLWEAWLTPGVGWSGPVDWSAQLSAPTNAALASAPATTITPGHQQLIFWQGTNNDLWEAWYTPGFGWSGPVDWSANLHSPGNVLSAPSLVLTPGGQQLIFWQGTGNDLFEAWYTPGFGWSGPVDWSANLHSPGNVLSAPSLVLTPGGQQLIFWQGSGNDLFEAWYTPGNGWSGPVDWSAQLHSTGNVNSAPSVILTPGVNGQQLLFWQGTNDDLWEAWYTPGNGWSGPLDWSAQLHSTGNVDSPPALALSATGTQLIFWQGTGQTLWEAWYQGGWNGPFNWSDGGPR